MSIKFLNYRYLTKPVVIGSIAVALLAIYFVFFYDPIQDIPPEFENIGFEVEPLVFEGRRIHFPYTDENNGESIIIKSDKKVYVGSDRSDVYFSVTNTGDKSEKVAILSYFPKEYGDINYVDVWSLRGRTSNLERGSTSDSEWRRLPLTRGDIKGNMTKLGKAFAKKKPVPDRFDVKAGIQFEISAGHTAYFKAEITYPLDKIGEFWFEAFGDQGGYGLLDPLFVGGTTLSRDAIPNWYSDSWTYRKRITIDKKIVSGTSDLSNFPILFSRTDNDFKHTSFGGNVASSSAGLTGGGGDFVFTSSDGTTKLDHEIQKYSSSSGELLSWVEIPTLSASTDTTVYIYYGGPSSGATNQNKTGTWDSNYVGVWHLDETVTDEATTGLHRDSTSNNSTGTQQNNDDVAGKIGNAQDFDGAGDYISFGAAPASFPTGSSARTVSWWQNPDAASTEVVVSWGHTAGTLPEFSPMYGFGANTKIDVDVGGNVAGATAGSSLLSSWHYITVTFNATTMIFYVDGASIGSATTCNTYGSCTLSGIVTAANTFNIGARINAGSNIDGRIDEVRISNSVRTASWILTEYNNQNQAFSKFASFGGQQKRTSSTTKIGSTTYSKDTPPGWYSDSWTYRKRITIDKKKVSGSSDLSNFPVLVSRTDPDFKHTSFGGNVASSSAGFTGGGGDFVFTSSDGTTKLDHEIEKYASSSGEIISWVEVPTLSVSADTILYVYYGGPSTGATNQDRAGTWDSNFKGVWHLADNVANTTVAESTSNPNDGTFTVNTNTKTAIGKIGNGLKFSGAYADTVADASLNITGSLTLSAWVKTSASDGAPIGRHRGTSPFPGYTLYIGVITAGKPSFWTDTGGWDTANSTVNDNAWHYIVVTMDGTTARFYKDAIADGTGASGNPSSWSGIASLGNNTDHNANFDGVLDELRISATQRSSDWIKTEYTNQSKPSTFLGFGGQQKRTSSTTKIGQTTTSKDTPPGWYSASGNTWDYRRKITIDKKKVSGTSNLSNFPVLVSLTYPDLKTTGFSGKAASGSGEFIFTSSDGTTSLPYEIETYSSSSGQFIGWVNVTTLSVSQDTAIYMYYGGPSAGAATNQNKTGTWDSNYVGVWHLPNGTTLTAKDSTSNAANGTITNTTATSGKIDGAGSFNGSNTVISGSGPNLANSPFTISAWVNPANYATDKQWFSIGSVGSTRTAVHLRQKSNTSVLFGLFDDDLSVNTSNMANVWSYMVVTLNSSKVQTVYQNGASVGNRTAGGMFTGNTNWNIGRWVTFSSEYWTGTIDEVRISNAVRSADWIKTEYNNQFKPSSFYGVGGLEKRY